MRSMYVYHIDDEIVHDVMDGVLYSVPPGEVYEFMNPFIGKKFLEHKWYHGVVEVEVERTRAGWVFKLDEAHAKAERALADADNAYNNAYIETQHQDRLTAGRPALPPSARQKKILKRQGVNLEDYGIVPIGTKSSQEKMFAQMVEQNQQMMSLITAFITGGGIVPAQVRGATRKVEQPVHQDSGGDDVLVPEHTATTVRRPVGRPVNFVAPLEAVQDRPEPAYPTVRLYSEGEDPATDPSLLGPEFAGDVDDPNQILGPTIAPADKPIDLHKEGLADALNGEETRVKLKVPMAGTGSKPAKIKVNL